MKTQILTFFMLYPVCWSRSQEPRSRYFTTSRSRSRNELRPRIQCCETGTVETVPVTCEKVGTGTVINYGSGTGTTVDIKLCV
jgi:hypothetical protein